MPTDISHLISLFENATEGFIVTGPEGNIVLVNPSTCRMFGYTAEEMTGQKIEMLLPAEYRSGHVKMRKGFHERPQNRVMGHGRDLYAQSKNGKRFPVEVSLSTYLRDDVRYAIAFIVDITRRKEIEQSMLQQQKQLEKVTDDIRKLNAELEAKVEERTIILKEALQRLEQSQEDLSEALDKERQLNEIKSRFVSMASHEFRTPLSAVLSSASLLSKYTTTEEQDKRSRHIDKIKGSVKQLNNLLEDFLSLGILDEGKMAASFTEFDLEELIEETIEEMKGLVRDGQEISFKYEGQKMIESDKRMIKNIVINLLSNAIKFSTPASPVQVISQVDKDRATLQFIDQGIGISREDQEHLFSSFFRGRNAQNIQGTGLGLHIVKQYLGLIAGEISLKSELGKRTAITLSIPENQDA